MTKRSNEDIQKRAAEAGLGSVVEEPGEKVEVKPRERNANLNPDNATPDTEAAD